jgi:hypothetical protein
MLCDLTMGLWTTATRVTIPAAGTPGASRSSQSGDIERPRIWASTTSRQKLLRS